MRAPSSRRLHRFRRIRFVYKETIALGSTPLWEKFCEWRANPQILRPGDKDSRIATTRGDDAPQARVLRAAWRFRGHRVWANSGASPERSARGEVTWSVTWSAPLTDCPEWGTRHWTSGTWQIAQQCVHHNQWFFGRRMTRDYGHRNCFSDKFCTRRGDELFWVTVQTESKSFQPTFVFTQYGRNHCGTHHACAEPHMDHILLQPSSQSRVNLFKFPQENGQPWAPCAPSSSHSGLRVSVGGEENHASFAIAKLLLKQKRVHVNPTKVSSRKLAGTRTKYTPTDVITPIPLLKEFTWGIFLTTEGLSPPHLGELSSHTSLAGIIPWLQCENWEWTTWCLRGAQHYDEPKRQL